MRTREETYKLPLHQPNPPWWSPLRRPGRRYPLYPTPYLETVPDMLSHCVRDYRAITAFRERRGNQEEDLSVTYGELGRLVGGLASRLVQMDLSGKRAALLGENSFPWILTYFACLCAGVIAVPLDKDLPAEELADFLRRTEADTVFYSAQYREKGLLLSEGRRGIPLTGTGDPLLTLAEEGAEGRPVALPEIHREDTAAIFFTSGTTGRAKAVELTHGNLIHVITGSSGMLKMHPGEVCMSVLPMNHAYESTCGILCFFNNGCTFCINSSAKRLLADLKYYSPQAMALVPLYVETLYRRIWDEAERTGQAKKLRLAIRLCNLLDGMGIHLRGKILSKVRAPLGGRLYKIICGGARLDAFYIRAFRDLGIEIFQGYGITECAPLVSVNRDGADIPGSAGYPLPGTEIAIRNPDREGTGEIWVKGGQVMKGYADDPEATARVLEKGWFHTGDLGRLDAYGYLWITGRSKNTIILSSGKNVQPEELEALFTLHPQVSDAMVMGIGDRNAAQGLAVVLRFREETASRLTPQEQENTAAALLREVNKTLPSYKRITVSYIRDRAFPLTSTRKINRVSAEKEYTNV